MRSRRLQVWFLLSMSVSALVACNALLGVADVKLKDKDAGEEEEEDGEPPARDAGKDVRIEDDPSIDKGSLALGFLHSCARSPNGTVRCWGDNSNGQVGDGVQLDASREMKIATPQEVKGVTDAVEIGAGVLHSCAIHKAGDVSCWGLNTFGQLGDGTANDSSKPVKVKNITNATQIVGGTSFTCALLADKTVSCWGLNDSGQLGDGTTTDRSTPALVKGLSNVIAISAGPVHACAVGSDGGVSCWGNNEYGQLGVASGKENPNAIQVPSVSDVVQVAAAEKFSCGRQKSGKVLCWGTNDEGQLGGGNIGSAPLSAGPVRGLADAIWLWVGDRHACVVRKSHDVMCWGRAIEGQLGGGDGPPKVDASIDPIAASSPPARAVYTGGDRTCEIALDSKAYCWGANNFGQGGNGTFERLYTPAEVKNFP